MPPGEKDLTEQVSERVADALGLLMHDITKRRGINYNPQLEEFAHHIFNTAFFLGTMYALDYPTQSDRLMTLIWGVEVISDKYDYSTALDVLALDISDNVLPGKKKTVNEVVEMLGEVKKRELDPVLDSRHPDGPLAPVWEDGKMTWEQRTLMAGSQAWGLEYPEGWDCV